MKKIGIIGLGLMGGSLAKALKQRYGNPFIVATNRSLDVLKQAFLDGVIDEYTDTVNESFKDCELVFICTPVCTISSYVKSLLYYVSRDCIITDVGSTKGSLFKDISEIDKNICFIGGHPMTGSEQTRYSASKESLYENTYYVLAPLPSVSNEKIHIMTDLVKKIGAIPITLTPDKHDYVVAAISHLPHIIASAIVTMVKNLDDDNQYMHTLAAGGFKDITRIASSSPDMWQNISIENKVEILNLLGEFKKVINNYEKSLLGNNNDEIWEYFNNAKQYRDTFANTNPLTYLNYYEIYVDILDQAGSIATVSTLLSTHNINIKNIGIINNREFENGVLQIIFDNQSSQIQSYKLLKEMNYSVYIKK